MLAVAFAARALADWAPRSATPSWPGALGVEVGDAGAAADVRAAVLELRRGKGMVLDPADHDTWSAGSFFTNPVLDPAERGRPAARPTRPRWPEPRRPGQDVGAPG